MTLTEKIKELLFKPGQEGPRRKLNLKLLLLLLVGAGLMLFSSMCNFLQSKPLTVEDPPALTEAFQLSGEQQLIQELTATLEQIRGVSRVKILLTLESTGKLELVLDQESSRRETTEDDGGGGVRQIIDESVRQTHVILRDSQGKETPMVARQQQPLYRGVLVVAEGVENPSVKAQVVQALRSVLGLSYHRITVLPRGN